MVGAVGCVGAWAVGRRVGELVGVYEFWKFRACVLGRLGAWGLGHCWPVESRGWGAWMIGFSGGRVVGCLCDWVAGWSDGSGCRAVAPLRAWVLGRSGGWLWGLGGRAAPEHPRTQELHPPNRKARKT